MNGLFLPASDAVKEGKVDLIHAEGYNLCYHNMFRAIVLWQNIDRCPKLCQSWFHKDNTMEVGQVTSCFLVWLMWGDEVTEVRSHGILLSVLMLGLYQPYILTMESDIKRTLAKAKLFNSKDHKAAKKRKGNKQASKNSFP